MASNSAGVKCARDLVQFVPFNNFKHSPQRLAAEVLEELPTQLVEYKEIIKRPPNEAHRLEMSEILPSHVNSHNQSYNVSSHEYNEAIQVMKIPHDFKQ